MMWPGDIRIPHLVLLRLDEMIEENDDGYFLEMIARKG